MSLQIWLPLNGSLYNQGLQNIDITNNGAISNDNGKIGKCYYFNNSTIIFDSFETTKSICFWIKAEKVNSAKIAFVDYKSNLAFGFGSDGNILVACGGNSSVTKKRYISSNFLSNVWIHIALVKKDSDVELWINGILQTERGSNNYFSNSVDKCYIGGRSTGANLECYLNDFRIYNHQLSEKEIKKISQGLILHYPLNKRGYGNANLITEDIFAAAPWATAIEGTEFYKGKNAILVKNDTLYRNTGNGTTTLFPTLTFQENTQYTISVDWCDHLRTDSKPRSGLTFQFVYTDETKSTIRSPDADNNAEWVHSVLTSESGKNISFFRTSYNRMGLVSVANLKLEIGDHETNYSLPDATLGNIEYDISGYQNNGTKNNITYDFDTPKYNVSSVFDSANTSYIKVNENNWAAQYAEKMTVNVWAYSTNWARVRKIYSCMQDGGWGTASGDNQGYLEFTVYVATNAERTTHSYQYTLRELNVSNMSPGWHMITFLYDSDIGHKIYLDGYFHSNCDYVSYGIKYNTNARLFLGCEANTANPTSPYFDGKLSDFRIYATALSDKDILSLYNNEAYIDQSNKIYGQKR